MRKSSIITGLDIGTSKIRVLVAQKKSEEENFQVLSLIQEPSSGVRKGVIVNIEEVREIVSSCLKKAQEQSDQKINGLYININGSHLFSTPSRGLISVSRADQKISPEDINRVLQAAQTFSLPSNKEILNVFPKEFIVDGEKGIKEPLGMEGVRLEVEVLAVGGFSPYLKNLTQAVLNSNVQILDIIPSPIAAAESCLNSRQKELGVGLLDIGAGTSGLCVFEEGNLIHLAILPIGSNHITNDIAIGLKTDIDTAERIKLESGICFLKGKDNKEKIETADQELVVFSQKILAKIITARVSEIFDQVQKELKKVIKQDSLPAGIVLTGGGVNLSKIVEFAKKELRLPCRIGKPQRFLGIDETPELATLCGLILTGANFEEEQKFSFSGKGLINKLKRIFKIFIP